MKRLSQFWRRDDGSELTEMSLVILPLVAILFLIINVSWILFARSSLQEAVREGVRYAVTGQTMSGECLTASVQQVVQQNSFGFITTANMSSQVSVQFYLQSNLSTPVSGFGSTAGGNVVKVSVSGVSVAPLGPVLISATPLLLAASSSDVMENAPGATPPCQ